jgi:hypothetical protein
VEQEPSRYVGRTVDLGSWIRCIAWVVRCQQVGMKFICEKFLGAFYWAAFLGDGVGVLGGVVRGPWIKNTGH